MKLSFQTQQKRQVLDITENINAELAKLESNKSGVCHLHILHTTAALSTADLDPGTDLDILDAFEELVPKLQFRHPHDPSHTPDHILSTLVGTDVSIPFEKNKLILGTWQKIVLYEFDGPRERSVILSILNS
jgi:secondary thiamine-phosphate synthase enzyme